MLRPVIVGVDGSAESLAAAGWAAREARLRQTTLQVVHAWSWQPHPGATEADRAVQRHWAGRILREAEDHLRARYPQVPLVSRQADRPALETLLRCADEAQVLVLGSLGLGGLSGFLMGSLALQVVARARCPVILVRAGEQETDEHLPDPRGHSSTSTGLRDVVLGLDLDQPCDEVIAFAYEAAALRGAPLRIVHVYRPPSPYAMAAGADLTSGYDLAAEREKALSAVVRQWQEKYPQLALSAQAVEGRVAYRLVHGAAQAGLLVVGRRHRAASVGPRIGAVAHAALHHAKCPVAVVSHS
ncbi:universal stress protein [Streptomyces sp. NBC_01465]|uniref:universal stress protein n=1 Tax=Streptomyces sp. NBC_01465 TaxID=2903878 RepID=UPI002E31CF7D|nr:universal stress protein [Streptomyces sp. NBC_01465]